MQIRQAKGESHALNISDVGGYFLWPACKLHEPSQFVVAGELYPSLTTVFWRVFGLLSSHASCARLAGTCVHTHCMHMYPHIARVHEHVIIRAARMRRHMCVGRVKTQRGELASHFLCLNISHTHICLHACTHENVHTCTRIMRASMRVFSCACMHAKVKFEWAIEIEFISGELASQENSISCLPNSNLTCLQVPASQLQHVAHSIINVTRARTHTREGMCVWVRAMCVWVRAMHTRTHIMRMHTHVAGKCEHVARGARAKCVARVEGKWRASDGMYNSSPCITCNSATLNMLADLASTVGAALQAGDVRACAGHVWVRAMCACTHSPTHVQVRAMCECGCERSVHAHHTCTSHAHMHEHQHMCRASEGGTTQQTICAPCQYRGLTSASR